MAGGHLYSIADPELEAIGLTGDIPRNLRATTDTARGEHPNHTGGIHQDARDRPSKFYPASTPGAIHSVPCPAQRRRRPERHSTLIAIPSPCCTAPQGCPDPSETLPPTKGLSREEDWLPACLASAGRCQQSALAKLLSHLGFPPFPLLRQEEPDLLLTTVLRLLRHLRNETRVAGFIERFLSRGD